MKKYKKLLFIFLFVLMISLGIFLYVSMSKENSENSKEKSLSEIEYLEKEIVNLLNQLNNVQSNNYKLSVKEIEDSSSKTENENKSEDNKEQQETNSNNQSNVTEEGEENNEEYTLQESGILTNTNEIDWEYIKTEIENLYSSIPTITLDLYKMDVSKEDVLGFNQEFDNLTKEISEENKENSLIILAKLYNYIPKFVDKVTDNENYKIIIETKSNLFNAYSKLDSGNWQEISKNLTQTIEVYSSKVLNSNNTSNKQDKENKIYIMLNELQNAVNLQNKEIFLIKYKNILEEINILY